MRLVRHHRRAFAWVAALLLALQPLFGLAARAYAASAPPGSAFAGPMVICTASGTVLMTEDGIVIPDPDAHKAHGLCCTLGCAALGVAAPSVPHGPQDPIVAMRVHEHVSWRAPDHLTSPSWRRVTAAPRGPPATG